MTTISPHRPASSDATKAWEIALRRKFTDWNHQRKWQKRYVVCQRVKAARNHSLAPFTSEDMPSGIVEPIFEATNMDINQWYDMLQAGKWYDVLRQLLPVPFEENAMSDDTPPFVTENDWETASERWVTALRKRFSGWEVNGSANASKEEVWPCLKQRLLWALEHPLSRLLPNHKNTIRKEMETADTKTIQELLDMLKAGQ